MSRLQGEGNVFLGEKERDNYIKRRKNSYRCRQAELLLTMHDWLLILSSDGEPITNSPCNRDVHFPDNFTNSGL